MKKVVIAVVLIAQVGFASMASAAIYIATDILPGVPHGHDDTFAYAISSTGVIAGAESTPNPTNGVSRLPITYDKFASQQFKFISSNTGTGGGSAVGINASRVAVINGSSGGYVVFNSASPYKEVPGNGTAKAISDAGKVTGTVQSHGTDHAYVWDPNGAARPTVLDDVSGSNALNERGELAGWVAGQGGQKEAMHATISRLTGEYVIDELGTLGGSESEAFGMNDNGMVVGVSDTASGAEHAFVYGNNVMKDLGSLPGQQSSRALDVNNLGWVVGTTGQDAFIAFLQPGDPRFGTPAQWRMLDLNDLIDRSGPAALYHFTTAYGINDDGWIAASGQGSDGLAHGFLLWIDGATPPTPPLPPAVPLPAGVWLLFSGAGALAGVARRRRSVTRAPAVVAAKH